MAADRLADALRAAERLLRAAGAMDDAEHIGRLAAIWRATRGARGVASRLQQAVALCARASADASSAIPEPPPTLTSLLEFVSILSVGTGSRRQIYDPLSQLIEAYRAAPALWGEDPEAIAARARRERNTGMENGADAPAGAAIEAHLSALRAAIGDEAAFASAREAAMAALSAADQTDLAAALTGRTRRQLSNKQARLRALDSWRAAQLRRPAERARHLAVSREM